MYSRLERPISVYVFHLGNRPRKCEAAHTAKKRRQIAHDVVSSSPSSVVPSMVALLEPRTDCEKCRKLHGRIKRNESYINICISASSVQLFIDMTAFMSRRVVESSVFDGIRCICPAAFENKTMRTPQSGLVELCTIARRTV